MSGKDLEFIQKILEEEEQFHNLEAGDKVLQQHGIITLHMEILQHLEHWLREPLREDVKKMVCNHLLRVSAIIRKILEKHY